ncbi:hypothetical protein PF005_g33301 [Phytophthora fragariae]|uniref:Uncharacterized protein n=1 Tax=Phytophthora fragariae TaxID=53985 RepID=A0A6A3UZZ0_9STRA|nr:hypothetical protein PF009_g15160 [Phytophthora fragariae]KAE8952842.1 hypothetical protein PF011_g32581 [Phytophthora fragariae]KAE9053868.1 hypothetical protein PF006_g33418 [Phytophthora fragariae]KAE9053898.1 hypothetical protein PF007_g32814 [Phytophthora fragariae]KAE9156121.1 hypothetical protein PF004_g32707 [Phytophthora fragariae]
MTAVFLCNVVVTCCYAHTKYILSRAFALLIHRTTRKRVQHRPHTTRNTSVREPATGASKGRTCARAVVAVACHLLHQGLELHVHAQ